MKKVILGRIETNEPGSLSAQSLQEKTSEDFSIRKYLWGIDGVDMKRMFPRVGGSRTSLITHSCAKRDEAKMFSGLS